MQKLRAARSDVGEARRELDHAREKATAAARGGLHGEKLAAYQRTLRVQRWRTLALLFGFTFLNGVCRRSLSSAGPSFVAVGLMTEKRADEIFMIGFEAFAVGKFLVVPMTLGLGLRNSMLLQMAISVAAMGSYLVAPASPTVQLWGWVVFRIASAMATSTMLPFVGAWYPREVYGRVFGFLFAGFQVGYLFTSLYWQRLLFSGRLNWRVPIRHSVAGFAALFCACFVWLRELPPTPPAEAPHY